MMRVKYQARRKIVILGFVFLFLSSASFAADASDASDLSFSLPPLDHGFQLLYNLDFTQAHGIFAAWEKSHPDDPMGPTADAAGLLFSEFHRLGVLESQFFELDKRFENRPKLNPDPLTRAQFQAALDRAEKIARARLTKNSKDEDALFSLTLVNGLQADYAALIEKRNLASLHYTKEAADGPTRRWPSIPLTTTLILPAASANI